MEEDANFVPLYVHSLGPKFCIAFRICQFHLEKYVFLLIYQLHGISNSIWQSRLVHVDCLMCMLQAHDTDPYIELIMQFFQQEYNYLSLNWIKWQNIYSNNCVPFKCLILAVDFIQNVHGAILDHYYFFLLFTMVLFSELSLAVTTAIQCVQSYGNC